MTQSQLFDFGDMEFPSYQPMVHQSPKGVFYLTEPGISLLSKPRVDLISLAPFLSGFDLNLDFGGYLQDETVGIQDGDLLVKIAGQICYLSFGPGRTKNRDIQKYIDNILSSGHGSVLEHANYTILYWGVSRSFTHELVRHRAGFGYSQVSQRYVDGSRLRFVERPEFQSDLGMHTGFIERIENSSQAYESLAARLEACAVEREEIKTLSRTDRRKWCNQAARALLPNETEAPIVVTGNARAWRHFLHMRASAHAETEIRRVAVLTFRLLSYHTVAPKLFGDGRIVDLPDQTFAVEIPRV